MKRTSTLLVGIAFSTCLFGQSNSAPGTVVSGQSEVLYCTDFHITRPLIELEKENPLTDEKLRELERDHKREYIRESKDRDNRKPQNFVYSAEKDGPDYGTDPLIIQTEKGGTTNKAPIMNFAGQTATGFRPMDPSGGAGSLNYYVQAINATTYRISNKTTGAAILTGTLGNLWSPATPNDGDPIVMYDRFADRWFISQFGVSGNRIYIAISQTNNPTGSWYTYTFTSANFPDYLKLSIWQDGYYMTSNQTPQRVYAFERTAMLAGSPTARVVSNTFAPPTGGGFFCPMPGDADGNGGLPAAGTPCPIFTYSDNAWGGGVIDAIRVYNASVTWAATSTMTITSAATLATSAFDASYSASWDDISQPGTTQKLDGIGGILQFRAQYRKWPSYNTTVLCWPVRISATQRSLMWCELRQTAGTWALYQQGVYAPDTKYRWMGSIAMDDNGAIALCYARASATAGDYMSLYYAGRVSTDPLGTFSVAEQLAIAGTGSQTGTGNRDGDYAQTALDPDGVTFWHTGEYMGGTTGANAARTRIYSFQMPLAGPVASVSIVSNDADNSICAGTSVTFTATPTNGGTTPTYQWYVNGSPVGSGGTTYTTTALANGDVVTAVMTSSLVPVTGSPATSNPITMAVSSVPTTANAGPNQTVCGLTATFAGNTIASGTGTWAQTAGPGTSTFGSVNSPTSTVTVSVAGTYTYTWTASNPPCASNNDAINITFTNPPTTSNAGTDQTICANTVTLAGNTPTLGTGSWSFISGPATPTITTPTSPTSGVTGLTTPGTYVLRWTISNAPCTASTDDVNIIRNGAPTTSNAGIDQNVCGLTATLAGNNPTTGTGNWTMTSGPGVATFGTSSSPTSTVTVTSAGTYTFTWTISNNPCTPSTDVVQIIFNNPPTTSNAGTDMTICSTSSSATLAGNTPTVGTGSWSFISGPVTPTITTPTSPTSGVTGLSAVGTYVLRWTINSAPCTASTDDVNIIVNGAPSTSNAGTDQSLCGTSATLGGNTPTTGTGNWTMTSGPGVATFGSSSSPSSSVNVSVTGTYTFTWTISNAPCTASTDVVSITFNPLPSISVSPATICAGDTTTLSASGALTYTWSPATGLDATVGSTVNANPSSTTTYTITGTSSAGCVNSTTVTVTVNSIPSTPTITISGADLVSSSATGNQWYLDGVIIPGATAQTYTPTASGTYTVVVSNGGCSSASSSGTNYITGIINVGEQFVFNMYPNPSSGLFTIEFNTGKDLTKLKIHNDIGQIVYQEDIAGTGGRISRIVKLKDVETGVYTLTLTAGKSEVVKKIMISK